LRFASVVRIHPRPPKILDAIVSGIFLSKTNLQKSNPREIVYFSGVVLIFPTNYVK